MWTDVTVRKQNMCPTYHFDFDLLNKIGFQDEDMIEILEEMRIFAEKEMKEIKLRLKYLMSQLKDGKLRNET